MRRKFNVTGWCNPEKHFIADVSNKLEQVQQMIEDGEYFIINRPRQYGKTTLLEIIARRLKSSGEWLVFNTSFELISDEDYKNVRSFCSIFLNLLALEMIELDEEALAAFLKSESKKTHSFLSLSDVITALISKTDKKAILLIDEVDKSGNNPLFLDFLALLRNKFLKRHLKTHQTFHSVILTGVHDVKNLKQKIRSTNSSYHYNSPWNIAADFDVNMSLHENEIIPMLEAYQKERNISMHVEEISHILWYYTSGYPFLVSAICKIVDEKILPVKIEASWTIEDVENAIRILVSKTNTNFDSLKKNLRNNDALYQLTYNIAVNEETITFNQHDETIEFGLIHGIFKKSEHQNSELQIHNLIYQSVIYDLMMGKLRESINTTDYSFTDKFMLPDHQLDMEKVLQKFQVSMKEHYSKKD